MSVNVGKVESALVSNGKMNTVLNTSMDKILDTGIKNVSNLLERALNVSHSINKASSVEPQEQSVSKGVGVPNQAKNTGMSR